MNGALAQRHGAAGGQGSVLVVGGGLAGMTAAHHLAAWGASVTLADSAPYIGGAFLLLDHTFTTDSCGLCLALPHQPSTCPTLATGGHPRITTLTGTSLTALEGEAGRFRATLHRAPRFVDAERCDACGICVAACPVTRPRNSRSVTGRGSKAIYAPPPRAEPYAYAIDRDLCTTCGACVAACPQDAIELEQGAREASMDVSAVVLAPGFAPFDAARAHEYGWGRCANVVTSLELERMLNRSGPTGGRILRPLDGRVPRRVAFVNCVGSRSEALGRPYCSSSCCMITAKQVGLSKEAIPEAEVTVFTMDVRAAGKGYERYVQRSQGLPGVTYRRGRPAAVHELASPVGDARRGDLRLLTPEGEEMFDLLVLAVGMGPAEGAAELAEAAGVAVDAYGFLLPGEAGAGSTSRPGVFGAGASLAPADVPETVTQAADAAALAIEVLSRARGQEGRGVDGRGEADPASSLGDVRVGLRPSGTALQDRPSRVGVFLCTCGGALERRLNVDAVAAAAETVRRVGHVERLPDACAPAGLHAIEEAATERELTGVVVAGCSPHLYADRFDQLMDRLALPVHALGRANIREGAAWPHGDDVAAATAAAQGEVAMAVAAVPEAADLPIAVSAEAAAGAQAPERRVLVLGGGLAGMTAALTLAELGVDCDLVERDTVLGGHLRQAGHTLDGLDAQALLHRTVERVEGAQAVRVMAEAALVGWTGTLGDFEAEIRVGEDVRGEAYGALVVATGADEATTGEYLYGEHRRVITQRALERHIDQGTLASKFSDLASVVMIQCVGSRDEGHPYCSRVCCGHAIKHALDLKAIDPSIGVTVLFRDIRTLGTRELAYQEARRLGTRFLRYEPPEKPTVEVEEDRLRVTVRDTLYDDVLTLDADLLVLATGIAPAPGNQALAELLGVPLDEDGFFAEIHPKLRPTDLPAPGLFLCGMAYGPRFITESVSQARSAAMRAALSVVRPTAARREAVNVRPNLCSFCGLCVSTCPYGARVLDPEDRVARVIDNLCHGCGVCVALCPNGASRQPTFEPARALAMVDAALM